MLELGDEIDRGSRIVLQDRVDDAREFSQGRDEKMRRINPGAFRVPQ